MPYFEIKDFEDLSYNKLIKIDSYLFNSILL